MNVENIRGANPEPERKYTGIQGLDITTAGHLFDPKVSFWMTNELNRGKQRSEWVGIEAYAAIDRPIISFLRRLKLPIPKGITAQEVYEWQNEFPNTMVTRVHPAFSATKWEAIHRIFLGELGNGLRHQVYQAIWLFAFGAANNMRGVDLVADLRNQGQDTIMNAHTNVIEGFAKSGCLPDVKRQTGSILAENERRYNSPVVDDQRVIYDPRVIVPEIVERYQEVDGLLIGVDHGYQHGIDMEALINDEAITRYTYAIHLANTTTMASHDTLKIGDEETGKFIKKVSSTRFVHPVRAALDYNPILFGGLSLDDQLKLIRETIAWIEGIQNGKSDTSPKILRFNLYKHSVVSSQSTKAAV